MGCYSARLCDVPMVVVRCINGLLGCMAVNVANKLHENMACEFHIPRLVQYGTTYYV